MFKLTKKKIPLKNGILKQCNTLIFIHLKSTPLIISGLMSLTLFVFLDLC